MPAWRNDNNIPSGSKKANTHSVHPPDEDRIKGSKDGEILVGSCNNFAAEAF
jgi:hypothetical protein